MLDVLMWLVTLPIMWMTAQFWAGVLKWGIRHGRTIGTRIQKAKSAFLED
jgi:hypothetical protein